MTMAIDLAELVDKEGGRFSVELGLDLDHRSEDVERWFLAATLFGNPIRTTTATKTWRVLDQAGVHTVADADARTWDEVVVLLDAGGYARYDFRTATRLQALAVYVSAHHGGRIGTLATESDPRRLEAILGRLPGWGPTTIRIFLRELRGIWPGARPPLDQRAVETARWLRIPLGRAGPGRWDRLVDHATAAGCDPRDVEAALVRQALRTRRSDEHRPQQSDRDHPTDEQPDLGRSIADPVGQGGRPPSTSPAAAPCSPASEDRSSAQNQVM